MQSDETPKSVYACFKEQCKLTKKQLAKHQRIRRNEEKHWKLNQKKYQTSSVASKQ